MNRCQVTLIGRVGPAPEVFETKNGKGANFSFATSERWRDRQSGERKERTTWHRVTVYSPGLVKMIENGNLKKGQFVKVDGTLAYEKWEKDGQKHERAKILLNSPLHSIDFLDIPKPRDEAMAGGQENPTSDEGYSYDDGQDIPF